MDEGKRYRIQRYGEVFTPQHIVERMCDSLDAEADGHAFDIDKTFLESTCGDGVFVMEILRRKFLRCRKREDYTKALSSVWGMDIQERNVNATIANVRELCESFFRPTKREYEIINDHIILCDSLKVMRMMNELNEREGIKVGDDNLY